MRSILPLMATGLSVVALVCSGLANWRAEHVAGTVLEARERQLIAWLDTQVRPIMVDFNVKYPDNPTKIEDVLSPLFGTLRGLNSPAVDELE